MFKHIKRFFKRLYYKILIKLRKLEDSKYQITESQKYIMAISRMAINHPDSEFQIEPMSGKRYLKNETVGIYIIFLKNKIEITNHIYHYDVIVTPRNWKRILTMYNNTVEENRIEYEEQIMSRVKNSLSLVYDKMLKNRK